MLRVQVAVTPFTHMTGMFCSTGHWGRSSLVFSSTGGDCHTNPPKAL